MENAIWRIIDVNFNRAREGVRVVEEFARFVINSANLSSKAKQIRHQLCGIIAGLDQGKLISARDSINDVGFQLKIDDQMQRKEARDIFIAAAKRLPEALRALSESIQVIDTVASQKIEALRFAAYTLEKEVFLALDGYERYKNVKLYVLLDGSLGDTFEDVAKACIDGGADCLQLRSKSFDSRKLLEYAEKLVKLCSQAGILSIINDRLDIALASGADGVHLGQDDMPVQTARDISPRPLLIGLSTHNPAQLNEAIELLPDYVGLGPTFPSNTKDFESFAGLDYLKQAVEILSGSHIGHAAIGGISVDNIDQVLETGIRTIAVCSAVTASPDPESSCRKIKERILDFS